MANDKEDYFPLITPLRGFAAISVLVYHVITFNNWDAFPVSWGLGWFAWGWTGVDILYIVSGFVTTLSAIKLCCNSSISRWAVFSEFMKRRMKRIIPLHYLTLFLYILVFSEVLYDQSLLANLIAHMTFTHSFFPEFHRSLNPVNWTLGVQMQFYLLLIVLVRFINLSNLRWFIGGAFIIAFAWRFASFNVCSFISPDDPERLFMVATQLPGMIDFFACGVLIALVTKSPIFSRFRNSVKIKLYVFAVFILIGCFSAYVFTAYEHDFWKNVWTVTFARSMLAILFSLLVIWLCLLKMKPWIMRLLAPLSYMGIISYGIYLFHLLIVLLLKDIDLDNIYKLITTLAISIAAASVSWHYFERRFIVDNP